MLYSINENRYINRTPHLEEYMSWIGRLSRDEISAIKNELNRQITQDDIHTSSWIPGKDWSGTVFQPIYEKACLRNYKAAGMCFGVILWEVLKERDDVWGFGKYEKNGIAWMTYFKIHNPPEKKTRTAKK